MDLWFCRERSFEIVVVIPLLKMFSPTAPCALSLDIFFKKGEHWQRAVPRWFFKGVKSCGLLWSRHLCYLTSFPWDLDPLWERWGWSNKQLTDHTWIGIKTLGEDFHIKVTRKLDGWLEFLKPPKETNLGVTRQGFSYCLTPKLQETTLQHSIDDGVFFYKCFFTHNLSDRTTLLFGSLPLELGAFKKDQSGIEWLTLYLAPQIKGFLKNREKNHWPLNPSKTGSQLRAPVIFNCSKLSFCLFFSHN